MAQLHSNSVVKQGLWAESPLFILTAVVTDHLLFARDYASTGDTEKQFASPHVIILSLCWLFLVGLSSLSSLGAREQALCSVGSSRIAGYWGVDCPHPLPPQSHVARACQLLHPGSPSGLQTSLDSGKL